MIRNANFRKLLGIETMELQFTFGRIMFLRFIKFLKLKKKSILYLQFFMCKKRIKALLESNKHVKERCFVGIHDGTFKLSVNKYLLLLILLSFILYDMIV